MSGSNSIFLGPASVKRWTIIFDQVKKIIDSKSLVL